MLSTSTVKKGFCDRLNINKLQLGLGCDANSSTLSSQQNKEINVSKKNLIDSRTRAWQLQKTRERK